MEIEIKILHSRLYEMYGSSRVEVVKKCANGLMGHLSGTMICPKCEKTAKALGMRPKRGEDAVIVPVAKHKTHLEFIYNRHYAIHSKTPFFKAALKYCIAHIDPCIATRYEFAVPRLQPDGDTFSRVPLFYSSRHNAFIDFAPFGVDDDAETLFQQNRQRAFRYRAIAKQSMDTYSKRYMLFAIKPRAAAIRVVDLTPLLGSSDLSATLRQHIEQFTNLNAKLMQLADTLKS